jgi:ParB-like chromosome segregation protein Spo0J
MVKAYCSFKEWVPTEEVKEHPRNPNLHSKEQIALLATIIREQGWRAPIAVSKRSGFIIRGHARLAAARLLGLEKVPVDIQEYDSEESELADLIADNRISELGDLSQEAVKSLMLELESRGFNIELAGFDEAAWETLKNAFVANQAMLPEDLPEVSISGTDPSTGRFILIYRDDEEKEFWKTKLGIAGDKIIWTVGEVS